MGWLDLEESVEELFAEFQDERDYERLIALNDIATYRGVASAERSKEWRATKKRDPGWVAKERSRQRARKLTREDLVVAKLEVLRKDKPTPKRRRMRRVNEQLTFAFITEAAQCI